MTSSNSNTSPFHSKLPFALSLVSLSSLGFALAGMPRLANALSVPAASVTLEAEPAPPAATPFDAPAAAPLQVESAEVFVDSTDYSVGATQPIDPATALAGGAPDQVQVQIESRYGGGASAIAAEPTPTQVNLGGAFGSIEVSGQGLGWSPSEAFAPPEQSVVTAAPYFNQKFLRPFTRLSTQNQAMVFPIGVPSPITSLFGWRTHPISGSTRMHTGTDIGAEMGAPVVAVMPGRVLLADFLGGYGMTVAIEHSDGTQQTLYGHLSAIFVKPGDLVQQGALIGQVGSTGNSTGPHLHFELRQLTEAGWMAIDAGQQLEASMKSLVTALKMESNPKNQPQKVGLTLTNPLNVTNPLTPLNPLKFQSPVTAPASPSPASASPVNPAPVN